MRLWVLLVAFHIASACDDLGTEKIEIISNDNLRLTVNFDEDDVYVKTCKVTSETQRIFLQVEEPTPSNETSENLKEDNTMDLYPFILMNECTVVLTKIQDYYDRKWEIAITANNSDVTCKTKTFEVIFFYSVPLLGKSVLPLQGQSFMQYMVTSEQLKSCYAKIDDVEVTLNLDSEEATYPPSFQLSHRIESLGRGKCGLKVNDVQKDDPKNYFLYASRDANTSYKAGFSFYLNEQENVNNFTLETEPLKDTPIECKSSYDCSLYNSHGKRVQSGDRDCSVYVPITSYELGTWKCIKNVRWSMEDVEQFIEVKFKKQKQITPIQEQKGDFLTIGCRAIKTNQDYCTLISPTGSSYFVRPGSATQRYTTLNLDLTHGICAIEIKLPLTDEEKGNWKCVVDDEKTFINVDKTSVVPYEKYIKENTILNQNFLLFCQVPYSSAHCHIISPNGTRFDSDPKSNSLVGECSYLIKSVAKWHNGTWQCVYARQAGEPMEVIKHDILVAESMYYYQELDVSEGDDVSLMCSTQGVGLLYCIYSSPNNELFYVRDSDSSSILSYNGKGLEYGDCGITIHRIPYKSSGRWQCITRIIDGKEETKMNIFVTVVQPVTDDTSLATVLGATFGAIAVIGLTAGFIIYRRRKSRRNNETENVIFTNPGNNEDRSNVPMIHFTHNNYDTSSNVPTIAI